MRSSDGDRNPFDFIDRHASWRIALPTDPTLAVSAEVNAGSSTFDLDGATSMPLDLELNAGSATVDLGAARVVDEIAIEMNAGSLRLTLPATSTARLDRGERRVGRTLRAARRGAATQYQ